MLLAGCRVRGQLRHSRPPARLRARRRRGRRRRRGYRERQNTDERAYRSASRYPSPAPSRRSTPAGPRCRASRAAWARPGRTSVGSLSLPVCGELRQLDALRLTHDCAELADDLERVALIREALQLGELLRLLLSALKAPNGENSEPSLIATPKDRRREPGGSQQHARPHQPSELFGRDALPRRIPAGVQPEQRDVAHETP